MNRYCKKDTRDCEVYNNVSEEHLLIKNNTGDMKGNVLYEDY